MSRPKKPIKGPFSLRSLLHLCAMQNHRLPLPTCANSPTYHHPPCSSAALPPPSILRSQQCNLCPPLIVPCTSSHKSEAHTDISIESNLSGTTSDLLCVYLFSISVWLWQHAASSLPLYGIRFHSEITHTLQGKELLGNFARHPIGWQEGQDDAKEFILIVGGDTKAA
jgi:hypothetical protein